MRWRSRARDAVFGAMVGWAVTFVVLMAFWLITEADKPGRQYPDPLEPCALLALFGAAFGAVTGVLNGGRWRR